MKTRTILAAAAAVACLSACTTIESVTPSGETVSQPGVVLPPSTETLKASEETLIGTAGAAAVGLVSPSVRSSIAKGSSSGTGLAAAVAGALLYFIYDPLAPNWTIKEQALDEQTYRLTLRAKSFRVGGDGEAIRVVERRARQLQREKGYTGYRLLDYSESIESATPFTYRVSEGTIQLVKIP
jgi:ABC-type oligopeptide transport system substrate-binding subunit